MAYAESTVGGNYGGSFRVWVNSIRTYYGNQAENFEEWRCEGGLNRVSTSGGRIYDGYNESTFTLQLGLNGVAASGRFSYDFGGGTGRMLAWGTGTTRVYRDGAGNGFGFGSRMDINLTNSPYLTSGWVVANDGVATQPRFAVLTALSMDSGGIAATDEGGMWLEFYNPSGVGVQAFLEVWNGSGFTRIFTSGNIGSRYNFDFSGGLPALFQQYTPNSNQNTVRIGIVDGFGHYDYRDRTYTVKNDLGQANPAFSDFDYLDTNSTTAAITGDNQVLIQGLSTLQINIPTTKKAAPNKYATMQSYNTTIGGYVNNLTYSSGSTVTDNVGVVSDVTGNQSLTVRAIDSRTNSTAASKVVNILPYASPAVDPLINVKYTNNYDNTSGLTVSVSSGTTIANISPLTLSGTDLNVVNATTGIQFDMSKTNNSSYTGTWVNVATTQQSATGVITANSLSTIATNILTKMNGIGSDNTVRWYLKFKIVDVLQTKYFETYIDVGKAIFRIGVDGRVYNNENVLMTSHIGQVIQSTTLDTATKVQNLYGGTWAAFASGRTLVGINTSDIDFATVEQTGGQKDVQTHHHAIYPYNDDFNLSGGGYPYGTGYDGSGAPFPNARFRTEDTGAGTTNMNPYIVVYMWERTA
jgi:hypothetical protein